MELVYTTHYSNDPKYFATLPEEDINNTELKYSFLYDYSIQYCCLINLDRCRALVNNGTFVFNNKDGANFLSDRQYKNYFKKIIHANEASNYQKMIQADPTIDLDAI